MIEISIILDLSFEVGVSILRWGKRGWRWHTDNV